MIKYTEDVKASEPFKRNYLKGLNAVIAERQQELAKKREEYCRGIFDDGERYREEFKAMLGWPLVGHSKDGIAPVRSTLLSKEEGHTVYRMEFEILEGLFLTGLYFEADGEGKKPLVLVQHGGRGTPELISGIHGNTYNYNDMLKRVISRGVHAFAPQLLLWETEKFGVEHNRANVDARLKRVGGSITAMELYGLVRILDYFETKENVSDFGMVGLSYGGFYTLYMAAIDTRIKSAISCSFFNTRDKYPWNDWTWFGAAERFDDAEVAALVYPRTLCLQIGTKDELFDVEYGRKSYEKLLKMCEGVGDSWVSLVEFDGKHEFCRDNKYIDRLIEDIRSQ